MRLFAKPLSFRGEMLNLMGLLLIIGMLAITGCGEEKVVIRYLKAPASVELISPPIDTFITVNNPTFHWHPLDEAVRYQIQVSLSPYFINNTINTTWLDTTYTTISEIPNNTYFWRVRGQNADTLWGDWSDADIWSFYKSDYMDYIEHLSTIATYGAAQDVYVRGDTAYIADGQADLTIIDALDKNNPTIIRNIDYFDDDYAYATYVPAADTIPYAFVADLDGHVQVINTADTSSLFNFFFGEQNIRDLSGGIVADTSDAGSNLYIFTIRTSPGSMTIYRIIYPSDTPYPEVDGNYVVNQIDLPANPYGVTRSGNYVYVACGEVGLSIIDITDIYNPMAYSSLILGGVSYAVEIKDDFAYVAADREGLYVIDIEDKSNPILIGQINTSGRSRDVHIVGNFAFLADGSGGLKVIDISVPDSAHFVVAYDTPYANGVWADNNYVYICDRDDGLLIFENRISRR